MKVPSPKVLVPFFVALALSACGVGPGPDLSGPEGARFLAAYSGNWVLLRLDSDDLDGMLRDGRGRLTEGTRGGAQGNMPGGRGGGGGTPPGGMTGGRGGGMTPGGARGGGRTPGGMARDPEEMQRIMQTTLFLSRTPGNLSLTLRPESVALGFGESAPLTVILGSDETTVSQGQFEFFAKGDWTKEGLVIERGVDGGGGVKDKIRLDDEGYLVVEREVDTGRFKVEGVLRYKRADG